MEREVKENFVTGRGVGYPEPAPGGDKAGPAYQVSSFSYRSRSLVTHLSEETVLATGEDRSESNMRCGLHSLPLRDSLNSASTNWITDNAMEIDGEATTGQSVIEELCEEVAKARRVYVVNETPNYKRKDAKKRRLQSRFALQQYTHFSGVENEVTGYAKPIELASVEERPIEVERATGCAGRGCIKLMQLNAAHASTVMTEVRDIAIKEKIDIVLLQEPYVFREGREGVVHYGMGLRPLICLAEDGKDGPLAEIIVFNPELQVTVLGQFLSPYCVCVEVISQCNQFYLMTYYLKYQESTEYHLQQLGRILEALRGSKVLVAADTNAESGAWAPSEAFKGKKGEAAKKRKERGVFLSEFNMTYSC